ncbi:multicopper oxidase family protein [Pelagibius sp.]|uniref:multicopper oxidase family protein n=1 Tax=Pelagibius sp. TaxID=1931238 RepID=UPI002601B69B|nr:multicopper oxidase family protein [Pelagibius sp.]
MSANQNLTRRVALGLLAGGTMTGGAFLLGSGRLTRGAAPDHRLQASTLDYALQGDQVTAGMMSFAADGPPPVLRLRRGAETIIDVTNDLGEPTTVHWHGLRIANQQDGVPYLTQWPIMQGETVRYSFAAPDAGTFWYHPHCNTLEQMARGMTGALIVEDDENAGFDRDLVLNLRDFRLGKDGQFIELFRPRQAARGGTFGTVMTANWRVQPTYDLPGGSLVRLRLIATDVTRIYRLSLTGAEARLIALDSHPTPPAYQPQEIVLAAGQRADLAIRVPEVEGETAVLNTTISGRPVALARLRAVGRSAGRRLAELAPLAPNPVAEPVLEKAEIIPFLFGWAPGDRPAPSLCGTLGYTFWSINRQPWPGDFPEAPGALAVLKKGRSYILRLRNETKNSHPIHLHGLTFRLFRSDKRQLPPLLTDTALLQANETLDIALVADNPGDWAFHCHVIEHQKTGLAGYIRVE